MAWLRNKLITKLSIIFYNKLLKPKAILPAWNYLFTGTYGKRLFSTLSRTKKNNRKKTLISNS